MATTVSAYPTGDQATTVPTYNPNPAATIGGTNAANPTSSFGVASVAGGGSPGSISIPSSTAQTAVPIAEQQEGNVLAQLPQYSQSLGNVGANIQSETAGQLPTDVVNQIETTAAERGIATGTSGSGSENAALLSSLGLNSLNLTQTGQQNLEGILPTLPGYGVSTSPSLYATPGQVEGASATAASLGNQNLNQNASLNAAKAASKPTSNPYPSTAAGGAANPAAGLDGTGLGGTSGTGGTGGTGNPGVVNAAGTGGASLQGSTNSASNFYNPNYASGAIPPSQVGTTGTAGTGSSSTSSTDPGNILGLNDYNAANPAPNYNSNQDTSAQDNSAQGTFSTNEDAASAIAQSNDWLANLGTGYSMWGNPNENLLPGQIVANNN